jgi:hypothetical protein
MEANMVKSMLPHPVCRGIMRKRDHHGERRGEVREGEDGLVTDCLLIR